MTWFKSSRIERIMDNSARGLIVPIWVNTNQELEIHWRDSSGQIFTERLKFRRQKPITPTVNPEEHFSYSGTNPVVATINPGHTGSILSCSHPSCREFQRQADKRIK